MLYIQSNDLKTIFINKLKTKGNGIAAIEVMLFKPVYHMLSLAFPLDHQAATKLP